LKTTLRKLFVLVLASAFWFGVFEGAARFWLTKYGDPLDRARLVLEPDLTYLWRVRPNLEEEFEGAKLTTDSSGFRTSTAKQNVARPVSDADWILIGPSSGFGWGVEESDTYIAKAAASSGKTYFNASQIGYGLSQGRRLYEDIRSKISARPRTIFVALGVNDVDRFRFFGPSGTPDVTVFGSKEIQRQLETEKWLYRWAFPGVFFRRLQEASFRFGCPPWEPLITRTTKEQFMYDLGLLLRQIEFDGHRVVVIDSPALYPFKIDRDLALKASAAFEASAKASREGNCKTARSYFKSARSAEPHRVALDIQNLNRALKNESTGKVWSKNWTLIEASALVIVSSDFVDPIHFSRSGHEKIASMIQRSALESAKQAAPESPGSAL